MSLTVRISAEADTEMAEAARWYESQHRGLGAAFLDAVDGAVSRITENPHVGSMVPGIVDSEIRRRPVRRFPYHVVYLELADRIQILAVAHDRRRPRYWTGRSGS